MNISTATTAELVAFYNANVPADKQIKKFADRATAEKRVQPIADQLARESAADDREIAAWDAGSATPEAPEHDEAQEAAVQSSVYGFDEHGLYDCPHCDIHLSNGVSQHGDDVNGKPLRHDTHQFECLGCGGGFGALIKRAAASDTRSAGIAASWAVPAVAEKRKARTGNIEVRQHNGQLVGNYRSVAHAFSSLGLSLKGHIPFRISLKLEGQKPFGAYIFYIAS
jgi:hypothetical protein